MPNEGAIEPDSVQRGKIPAEPFWSFKEIVASVVAVVVLIIFGILMYRTVSCILGPGEVVTQTATGTDAAAGCSNCPHGIETLNILANVFGPLVGIILAFYFSTVIIRRS